MFAVQTYVPSTSTSEVGMSAVPHSSEPEALLAGVAALRRDVRRDRHAYWLPLLLFGALALASAPLYIDPIGPDVPRAGDGGGVFTALGGHLLAHSAAIGWFWLAALIGGYLASLWWYRRHAQRVGLQTPTRAYLTAGVIGVLVGLALGPVLHWLQEDAWSPVAGVARVVLRPIFSLMVLGLVPLAVVAVGLLVLARLERSRLLAGTAAVLLATLLLGPVYVSTLYLSSAYGYLPVVIVPALVLLAGGLAGHARRGRR
jgi:hypothetical protein